MRKSESYYEFQERRSANASTTRVIAVQVHIPSSLPARSVNYSQAILTARTPKTKLEPGSAQKKRLSQRSALVPRQSLCSKVTMRSWLFVSYFIGAFLSSTISAALIPPPTGQYNVGVTKHVLNKTTKRDPTAPNRMGQSFLVTLYYPTLSRPKGVRPYIPRKLAEMVEEAWFYPAGSLSNASTTLQWRAPPLSKSVEATKYPTLVFGPGGAGPSTDCYTALLSELASQGYTVAALDHPFEQPFLQYPEKGPGIIGMPLNSTPDLALYNSIYDFRISDTQAFLGAFPWIAKQFNYPFNTTHVALFGHSLGGAAAIGAAQKLTNVTIMGALNLDGTLFGAMNTSDAKLTDLKKPVFMMGNGAPHNYATDRSWLTFPLSQSGWWRQYAVAGALPLDFSDVTLWKQFNGSGTPQIGLIEGKRMVALMRTYVTTFFDKLRGEKTGTLLQLDMPAAVMWPEVVFHGGRG
jgi:pimeloyl-ACP methyl ester carboxylesterase